MVLNGLSSNADLTELPFLLKMGLKQAGSPFVPVRDTVGCGDSAAAAIVLGYLNIERARWRDMKDTSSRLRVKFDAP